jgi:hypothetical protein
MISNERLCTGRYAGQYLSHPLGRPIVTNCFKSLTSYGDRPQNMRSQVGAASIERQFPPSAAECRPAAIPILKARQPA